MRSLYSISFLFFIIIIYFTLFSKNKSESNFSYSMHIYAIVYLSLLDF